MVEFTQLCSASASFRFFIQQHRQHRKGCNLHIQANGSQSFWGLVERTDKIFLRQMKTKKYSDSPTSLSGE
ncbi:hypothetical protein O6P43_025585 [Quillaja saponaria]|uniref:Uncharacterized protein n=1 Tax=Quillaja saponaria TaxID=32244 RepID=A0AAD7PGD8_QUISA|nr:hypothetical protein O6P43_025585 [Quillaja saponaria]